MINFSIHRDETSDHIHILYSNIQKQEDGTLEYSRTNLYKKGYGSNLQTKMAEIFKKTVSTKEEYCRGEKKGDYRDIGNDHSHFRDMNKNQRETDSFLESMPEDRTPTDMLDWIENVKSNISKGNNSSLKFFLNKLQRAYKKLSEIQKEQFMLATKIDEGWEILEEREDILDAAEEFAEHLMNPEADKNIKAAKALLFKDKDVGKILKRMGIDPDSSTPRSRNQNKGPKM